MTANPRYKQIDKFESEFWNIVSKAMNIKVEGMATSASSSMNGPITFNARFPTKNRNLEGTRYLNKEIKKILHFTSLQKMFSIINESSLRLYNLNNSNDTEEYIYAANKLRSIYLAQGIKKEDIEKQVILKKEYSFICSCTTTNEISNATFWKEYGYSGKGVAIEFEIVNDVLDWEYFYLSKVQYNNSKVFDTLINEWSKIQSVNPIIRYNISLDQILSLHKSLDWQDENEIRILSLYPDLHQSVYNDLIYTDINPYGGLNKQVKYFKLPLCNDKKEFTDPAFNERTELFWHIIPRIKISDIHFGPDFDFGGDIKNYQVELRVYIAEKLGCFIRTFPKNKVEIK